MVNLTIDHIPVTVPEGTTILDAARSAGIHIPSLCYLRGVNEIGACRVCVVELCGMDRLVPACNNVVEEGMEVLTSSPKVRETGGSMWSCFCPSTTAIAPPVCAAATALCRPSQMI